MGGGHTQTTTNVLKNFKTLFAKYSYVHTCAHGSGDNSRESVLFLYYVGPEYETQVVRLGGQPLSFTH